jgi:LacI family transcriptional regulator
MRRTQRTLTSRDLARLAGVSQSTVSRVLTNNPRVNADTRARVLKVLEEQNYSPNALARAMKTGRTDAIGVFMSRVTSPFHADLLDLIGRRLAQDHLQMVLWNVEHNPAQTASQVISQGLVDGFVFTSATFDSQLHTLALKARTPTVLLHRGIDDLPCDQVVGDNWQGARDVGRYLVHAGHRRVGLVGSTHRAATTRDREQGFRAAPSEAGVDLHDRDVATCGFSHGDGHAAGRMLLDRKDRPTAIFAITDILGFGVLDAARSLGVGVPDDLWVAGFDNTGMASWESFDLTTVDQPVQSIVDSGIDLLRQRISDPSREPTITRLPCPLVVRGSTAHHPVSVATPTSVRRR